MSKFKFAWDDPNALCIACWHVVHRERPVKFVSHVAGEWVLTCGAIEHEDELNIDGLTVIHMRHLLEHDESLDIVSRLEVDQCADREFATSKWLVSADRDD